MLVDLKVLNGNLELKYNEYTYEYTVKVDNNVNNLELDYKLKDDCYLKIRNNNLTEGENIVYLDVYNVDTNITYTLYVYKEKAEEVSMIDNYISSIEINNTPNEVEIYKVQILTISVFILIIIIFSIMFRKKSKNY